MMNLQYVTTERERRMEDAIQHFLRWILINGAPKTLIGWDALAKPLRDSLKRPESAGAA